MFISQIPLSKVRAAAKTAASHWYLCQRAFENAKYDEALRYAELAQAEMVDKGRILAGSVIASLVISAIKKGSTSTDRHLIEAAMTALDGELARLSNGKVRPTLHLSALANAMSRAVGRLDLAPHALFLPVEPVAIEVKQAADSAGSVLPFEQALAGYSVEFSARLHQFKAGGNADALKDMSAIASSIERRLPAGRAGLIAGAFSAWSAALAQMLKAPSAAQLQAIGFAASTFDAWLREGTRNRSLPDDKWMVSRTLFNLMATKANKRVAVMVNEYGLNDIASKAAPSDLSVSLAVLEGYWQQVKMAWEEHLHGPAPETLMKVHEAIIKFGAYASGGNEDIRLMVQCLSDLLRRLEPGPGSASAKERSIISSGIARSLDAVAKMIADKEIGLLAVTGLRQDLISAQSNDVDLISAINHDDILIPASALHF